METVVIIIIVAVFFLIIRILKSPKTKGVVGEFLVERSLGRNIPHRKYVIHDVLLYDGKRSYQIDHIVIRKTGVFVIETKYYSGRIYGQENQKKWTQVLSYGREKNYFYNPISQNRSHIYALGKIIGRRDCFVSIIVFPKAKIMTRFETCVGSISKMKRYIRRHKKEILTTAEIESIYNQLIDFKQNPRLTHKQHRKNVRNLIRSIEKNICPRCNSQLVKREGKYGSFYGCSDFPKCRFVKR